ncbi:hypothetical protein JIR001_07690 [Polycladomyces abyssicola]|uniref:Uncharacterized protein n=1 Tax=Polycladomyces abyssicola TaxID=1125966 RepID=A0A8D5ZN39_9BACL|nr:hypothetical protein JIR001_07690 [Polycladomyces abyssicola]
MITTKTIFMNPTISTGFSGATITPSITPIMPPMIPASRPSNEATR